MSDQARGLVGLLAVVLLILGIYLGFAPIQVAALNGTADCGSAFSPKDDLFAGSLIVAECDSKRSDRRTLAIALLVVGAVPGFLVVSGTRRNDPPESSDPASSVTP